MTTRAHEQEIDYREYLVTGVLVALALLLLPALAVLGFFMQFAFVIIGPVLLIAALVYAFATPAEH